jgi:signal peptidase I
VTSDAPEKSPPGRRRRLPWYAELLTAIIAVALVQAFLVKPFGVPSGSMEDTLHIGDRIVANRLDTSLQRGDIIVFGHGATWQASRLPSSGNPLKEAVRYVGDVVGVGPSHTQYTVKRLIGLPGDHVGCCTSDGRVTVNGTALNEPYVFEDLPFTAGTLDCSSTPVSVRCFPEITVPRENLLVLGDHRSNSADSVISCRGSTTASDCATFVPLDRVVGPVVFRLWPLGAAGTIP